jgi:hypothetical protein
MVPPFSAGVTTAALTTSCGTAGPTRPGSSGGPLILAVQGGAARIYQDAVQRFNRAHPNKQLEIRDPAVPERSVQAEAAPGYGRAGSPRPCSTAGAAAY